MTIDTVRPHTTYQIFVRNYNLTQTAQMADVSADLLLQRINVNSAQRIVGAGIRTSLLAHTTVSDSIGGVPQPFARLFYFHTGSTGLIQGIHSFEGSSNPPQLLSDRGYLQAMQEVPGYDANSGLWGKLELPGSYA